MFEEEIKSINELRAQISKLKSDISKIENYMEDSIMVLADRYFAAKYKDKRGYGVPLLPISDHISKWYIEGDRICIGWSEHWAYDGHDGGCESIPIEFLYDESKIIRFEKEQSEKREKIKMLERQKEKTILLKRIKELEEKET